MGNRNNPIVVRENGFGLLDLFVSIVFLSFSGVVLQSVTLQKVIWQVWYKYFSPILWNLLEENGKCYTL